MKKLLLLLLLSPTILLSQTLDTWVNLKVQYDFYGPSESSFYIVSDSTGDTSISHQPTVPYQYLDTLINLASGDYTVTLIDSYGDGWTSSQPAWFIMENACQGAIIDWQLQGLSFFLRDTTVNVMPCAPPTTGCTNPIALNYDSLATVDDGSCVFPSCGGFDTAWATQQCVGAQVLTYYEWTTSPSPNCDVIRIFYGSANFNQVYDVNINNGIWGVYMGNGQQPPNWDEERYFQVMFADSTLSDTLFYTPYACTPGCTDSTADNYNPWATYEDGSCDILACDSLETEITISLTLDGYPGETSWTLIDITNGQAIDQVQAGDYDFGDAGQTFTYTYCVVGFEFILYDSYGDGLAGSTTGGSIDGSCTIYDCDGDTIWSLPDPGFGSTAYSGGQWPPACAGPISVDGCTDPAYQEYNPLANNDDGSCTTLHILGCTDTTAFNYDPNATAMDIVPVCNYILQIEDDGGDGWGNSYLGVAQGSNTWTFTMGPGYYTQSFPLSLDTDEPITVYYFQVGGPQQTLQQIGFQTLHNSFLLTNSLGDTLLSEGTNPFYNNGQGALQPFQAPLWTTYSAMPYCGDYCIESFYGCMDSTAFNYDSTANIDDGGCIPVVFGCTNPLAFNYDVFANVDDSSCVATIVGCMDTTAFNYNPLANVNDSASCVPVILGCMDNTMFNYNSGANTDDGSCIPFVYGCMDAFAYNYDSLANTDDGSCIPIILGCTDITAWNYDNTANTDDGSCIPFIYGCTDPLMWNYDVFANTDNGSCIPFIYGCTDSTQFNYDPLANTDNGSCVPYIYGCTNPTSLNYDATANTDDGSCITILYGCTDSTMFNYNPLANVDNGSCIPFVYGCTNPTALNFDPLANTDDFSCILPIYGCTDSTMYNYNPLANLDNGSCVPFIYGCTNPIALNFDQNANTDDFSCILPIYGCMDSTAYNYDPLANVDNGTCTPVVLGCTNPLALNYDPLANTDDFSCVLPIYGCMDSTAFNYNPLANVDNGSCVPIIYGCTDPTALNYCDSCNTDDFSCILPIYGCTDSTMFNYNPLANVDNNSCVPFIYGCTDPSMLNYDPQANTEDFSCIAYIYGCTDSTALNYDSLANTDNGSCVTIVLGCMDQSAYNYDATANVNDSLSCLYNAGCITGAGNPYWLNDPCYAWVIDVDNYCCENEWDDICQSMYNYCENTWTGPVLTREGTLVIYPNPTSSLININKSVNAVIYNNLGDVVISKNNTSVLDVSKISPGAYILRIEYKEKIIYKKIIKE